MAIRASYMKAIRYSSFFFSLLMLSSCHKLIQLPDTPHIEFRSFTVLDTIDQLGNECKGGRLKFYFEDGDGDIGLKSADYGSTDTTDLFFKLYRKTNGVMAEVPDNDLMRPSDYRIPYMERTGRNKILKGTIDVTFFYIFYSPSDSNIIKYSFYLKDRADNLSDTANTCEIPLSKNNTYTIKGL
jgi:hypothetical protein